MVPLKLIPMRYPVEKVHIDFKQIVLVEGTAIAELEGNAGIGTEVVNVKPDKQPVAGAFLQVELRD